MELKQIVERFAEGLVFVDTNTTFVTVGNRRKNRITGQLEPGVTFLPGVKTMKEPQLVSEIVEWWKFKYPNEINPKDSIDTNVVFPGMNKRYKCDLIFSSDGAKLDNPEWAIEVQHISFCGNNGKKNDFTVQKILSPYRKDHSLIHDMNRLRSTTLGRRRAVIGYCFNYSFQKLDRLEKLHPAHKSFIDNIREEVCKTNNPETGDINIKDMVDFANEVFTSKGVVRNLEVSDFFEATRHPCGGDGTVFGWEIETTI
jgi:hypothetical protein